MNGKEIEQLSQGNFEQAKIDEWFEYISKYSLLIAATIEGCSKKINKDMFSLILMYAKKYYLKTKDSSSTKDILTNTCCEDFLKKLIIISSIQPEYKPIIKGLANFPNDIIRMYYCAYIDHKEFLNDNSTRIRKIANIINNFYTQTLKEIYDNLNYEQLDFLTSAIKYGAIQMISLTTPTKNDEITTIKFKSSLFNWNDLSINPNLMNFDVDVLYTIPNKQILASIILNWIKEGRISFIEEMTPTCFKQNKHQIRVRKPNK